MNFWRRLFPKPPLPPKDPMDWKLTNNSKPWQTGTYCPQCKGFTEHADIVSDICHHCGSFGDMSRRRSYRQIWDGSRWIYQIKYGNTDKDYVISE